MSEKNQIFRQKSLDRISSPEELDQYVKTTSPSIIILIIAAILFVVGVVVWGLCGHIETKSSVGFNVEGGYVTIYIKEDDFKKFNEDSSYLTYDQLTINDFIITETPIQASSDSNNVLLHSSGINVGEWYYEIHSNITGLADGNYNGTFVFESISPIVFIFNN